MWVLARLFIFENEIPIHKILARRREEKERFKGKFLSFTEP